MNIYIILLKIMVLVKAVAGTMPVPELQPGQKPNFIVIVTDDQGWDDIGINNPKYINTPNLDKFIKGGMLFDNYYTAPQCAQTRAQLLTGRAFARTGTMLTHGCYDFIHSDESTMGAVLQQAGYYTAQFGKWHNLDALGYEPWNVGFMESAVPKNQGPASLMQVNGVYTPNHRRYIEQALSDRILHFAKKQARQLKNHPDATPFLLFYSPHAIHVTYKKYSNGTVGERLRFFPPEYKEKYHYNPYYKDVPVSTLDAWAMLEYLDLLLGLLWDFVAATPELQGSTYIMVMSDNGSSLMADEQPARDKYRMPSKVKGNKSTLFEGGIRGWLAVQGPGIPAGVVDSTLLDATDILPTIVDLAGLEPGTLQHFPWDGLSFKNLLLVPESRAAATGPDQAPSHDQAVGSAIPAPGWSSAAGDDDSTTGVPYKGVVRRGTAFASLEQWERFLVVLGPQCWDGDLVLTLNGERDVLRPQPLLRWKDGGMVNAVSGNKGAYMQQSAHPGFRMCVVVRHKQYKWSGLDNKVYRLDSRHLEEESAVVTGEQGRKLSKLFNDVARSWWDQMVSESHSFEKPVFYLGLGNWTVTNLLTCGAYQRTRKTVKLQPIGSSGFQNPGDRLCFNVKIIQNGTYDVTIFYVSSHWSTFQLYVGTHAAILIGRAPSVVAQLPPSTTLAGRQMGSLEIPAFVGRKVEACLVLVENGIPGHPVMTNLANVRLTRLITDSANMFPDGMNSSGGFNESDGLNRTDTVVFGSSSRSSFDWGSGSPSGEARSGTGLTHYTPPSSGTPTSDTFARDTTPTGDTFGGSGVTIVERSGSKPSADSQSITELGSDAASESATIVDTTTTSSSSSLHKHQLARSAAVARNQLNILSGSRQHRQRVTATTIAAAGGRRGGGGSSTALSSTAAGSTAPVAAAAVGLDVLGQYSWLLPQHITASSSSNSDAISSSAGKTGNAWENARWRHGWPDGTYVLESMFAPYEWEDTTGCAACHMPL